MRRKTRGVFIGVRAAHRLLQWLAFLKPIPTMKKILIFTAGFGEGHNTAARSLRAALELAAPGEVDARVIDLFADFVRKFYIGMINRAPWAWEKIYRWLDSSPALNSNLGLLSKMQRRLAEILEREKPFAVVSTYPVYNYLIDNIYAKGAPRTFLQITIVTDSITVNSVWHRCGSDFFIVPNADTADVLRGKIDDAKIKVLGFPVTHRFSTEAIERPLPAEGNRRVLYMINSGKKEAPNLVRRLLELPEIQLTVTVGRDADLQATLEKVAAEAGRAVEFHGWTDKLPNLVMSHHLLISKAGGATVQETIAAKTPMLIMQVVPGQEEGNAQLLLSHESGALTESTDAIVKQVREAFANDAQLWRQWSQNIAQLSRPDAALQIARFVLDAERGGKV
jgi:UDP-N-acetylglucosamine:LPS N-acetylglucosamine transferase